MVAITVILAAVIETFVIGLGDDLGGSAPSASFDVSVDDDEANATVVFTHNGGDRIPADESRVVASVDDISVDPSDDDEFVNESLTAGSTVTVTFAAPESEETVRLVYDDGSRSATLATATVE